MCVVPLPPHQKAGAFQSAHVAFWMHVQVAVEGMERQSQQANRYVQQERLPPAVRAAAAPPIPSVDACLQGLQDIRWVVWGLNGFTMANHWDMHASWRACTAAWHASVRAGSRQQAGQGSRAVPLRGSACPAA